MYVCVFVCVCVCVCLRLLMLLLLLLLLTCSGTRDGDIVRVGAVDLAPRRMLTSVYHRFVSIASNFVQPDLASSRSKLVPQECSHSLTKTTPFNSFCLL